MANTLKLPLKRVPYSGSTDSYIVDADDKNICRVSPSTCEASHGAVVAFPDKIAEQIVVAVNRDREQRIFDCPYDGIAYRKIPGYVDGYGCPVCGGLQEAHSKIYLAGPLIGSDVRRMVDHIQLYRKLLNKYNQLCKKLLNK